MTNPLLVRYVVSVMVSSLVHAAANRCVFPPKDVVGERCKGGYDFIKLPFDFQNKCNRGHVFINLTDPASVIPFYQAFKRMQWVETVEEMQQFLMLRCREKMHSRPTSIVKLEDMHVIRYDLNKRILEGKRDSM
ncbi:uncharacterized protein LOC114307104 isoform X4 [Camellia sinensis]|uniref:uncharacterized protein LOC114307104 isoform X3 n=1 Tax=Camellia sinensis TaxID=4442 RepID=UPI001035F56D|nr:uncharacterized protein LOC114307104 isoform X3 [Camellia sinensis]XP_028108270.1 uncharacterized protein LOC114307104 isoform X4 [Camellia sinensis]